MTTSSGFLFHAPGVVAYAWKALRRTSPSFNNARRARSAAASAVLVGHQSGNAPSMNPRLGLQTPVSPTKTFGESLKVGSSLICDNFEVRKQFLLRLQTGS